MLTLGVTGGSTGAPSARLIVWRASDAGNWRIAYMRLDAYVGAHLLSQTSVLTVFRPSIKVDVRINGSPTQYVYY